MKSCPSIKKGEALFIYTGAPVPGFNKTIIPKENYTYSEKERLVRIKKIDSRDFIRFKGRFLKKEICFSKNEIFKS